MVFSAKLPEFQNRPVRFLKRYLQADNPLADYDRFLKFAPEIP